MSASNFLSLSNKRVVAVRVQLHPIIQQGSSMSAVPEILRGERHKQRAKFRFTITHTHTNADLNRSIS